MKRFIGTIMLSIILIIAGKTLGAQNFKFGYIYRDELLKTMPDYDSAIVNKAKGCISIYFKFKLSLYKNNFIFHSPKFLIIVFSYKRFDI